MIRTIVIIVGLAIVAGIGNTARSLAFSHHRQAQRYEDVYYLPTHTWLKLGSTGYREAGASLLWLRALVYYGDELIHKGTTRNLQNYSNAIIGLDPSFRRVYSWAATMSVFQARAVVLDDANFSIDILRQGRKHFPDDGELAWKLGATYTYELRPLLKTAKERNEASSKGREMFRTAAALGGGPPWTALTAASELTELGQTEQARRQLLEVYDTIDDTGAKQQLELRLEQLNSSTFVLALRATVLEFNQRHAEDFPYADRGLYYLLGYRTFITNPLSEDNYFDPIKFGLSIR